MLNQFLSKAKLIYSLWPCIPELLVLHLMPCFSNIGTARRLRSVDSNQKLRDILQLSDELIFPYELPGCYKRRVAAASFESIQKRAFVSI